MRCLTNIGDVYRALGEFDKALASYEQALQLSRGTGIDSLRGMGETYLGRGEPSKALNYFEVEDFDIRLTPAAIAEAARSLPDPAQETN